MKLEGLDGVLKNLRNLDEKMRKKHVWGATLAGATIIRKAAQAKAKAIDDPGTQSKIAPYIKARRAGRMAKKNEGAAYRVGVEGGSGGKSRVPPNYWRHVEFGTEDTRAQPFMRPAMNDNVAKVFQRVADSLAARMKKEIK